MAQLLLIGTHGPEDPTKATLPFHIGRGAKENGTDVAIVLGAESTVLIKDTIANGLAGLGVPPLKELWQFAMDQKIPIYV